jgi:hypothetical protein
MFSFRSDSMHGGSICTMLCRHGYRHSRLCVPAARRREVPTRNVASGSSYAHIRYYCATMRVTYRVAPAFLAVWLALCALSAKHQSSPRCLPYSLHRTFTSLQLHTFIYVTVADCMNSLLSRHKLRLDLNTSFSIICCHVYG